MNPLNYGRRRLSIVGPLTLALLVVCSWTSVAYSATSVQNLLSRAVHNTNTVHTLVYKSTLTEVAKNLKLSVVTSGQEDEVQNRERDREVVSGQSKQSNGTVRKVHYTVDIIFMNGQTYYRSSTAQNQWHTQSGMRYCDRPSGSCWQRGRTTVSTFQGAKFLPVGQTSPGSAAHLQASINQSTVKGTVDVWISGGSTPYVTRVDLRGVGTTNGHTVQERSNTTYGPFNQPLNIQPPTGTTA